MDNNTVLAANVLLVDDALQSRKIATAILERFGCTVTTANDGIEAYELLKETAFDIIFMDCEMPGLTGYETTQHIRQKSEDLANPNPIVVALTANSRKGEREKCLQAGMNDYISKPISSEALRMCVERWIDFAA